MQSIFDFNDLKLSTLCQDNIKKYRKTLTLFILFVKCAIYKLYDLCIHFRKMFTMFTLWSAFKHKYINNFDSASD